MISPRFGLIRRLLASCFLLFSILLCPCSTCALAATNQLVIHPRMEDLPRSASFTVKLRIPGGKWQELPVYKVKVSSGVDARSTEQDQHSQEGRLVNMGPKDSAMALFDFSGQVEVEVTYNSGVIHSAKIRPLSSGLKPTVKGNTFSFLLAQPRNLFLEVNGSTFDGLHLLANEVENNTPDRNDPNVIYFSPGTHHIGRVMIPKGKTVYLAAGALVEGSFLMSHTENVRISGRGLLYQPTSRTDNAPIEKIPSLPPASSPFRKDALLVEFSKDIEIDGITVLPQSYTVLIGQSEHITIKNVKSFSSGSNHDGIDVFSSSDVLIDGVFLRNSDDNIAIYGHRWNYYGDTERVTVQNATLWADVAHPILVGTHGDSSKPETLEDLSFQNIDILDHREPQLDYQGCMSLNAGDANLIRKVRFDDIRVEDFRQGQLLNLRVFFNSKYNTSPGRGIEDVLFRNITYSGMHANPSIIAGYDDNRSVKNIIFENLVINGTPISDDMPGKPGFYKTADMARVFVGEHVGRVTFRNTTARTSPMPKDQQGKTPAIGASK